MAKILGARVVTTAGTDDKVRLCRELGADLAINYKTQDVDAAINQFAPKGINVWWETLREPNFERAIPLLAVRGRMIVMAGRDARPAFPVGPFYVKDCSLHGFTLFNATPSEQRAAAEDINQWLVEGTLKARIDGNHVGNSAIFGSGGTFGPGIRVFLQGKTLGTITIVNNIVRRSIQRKRGAPP
jgi:NADPH2:quinone reductase